MLKSDSIALIAPALVAAQAEIRGAERTATNPHLRSKYADLASVFEACRAPLAAQGIAIVQTTDPVDPPLVRVCTTLMHKSGEWLSCSLLMRAVKDDPQGLGSAITYARRYTLSAIAGICPEDDDGHAASTPPARQETRVLKPAVLKPPAPAPAADGGYAAPAVPHADRRDKAIAKLEELRGAGRGQIIWGQLLDKFGGSKPTIEQRLSALLELERLAFDTKETK